MATPRTVSITDLVGVTEIAARLNRGTSVVTDWRRRYTADHPTPFPPPVATLAMGNVWSWPDVEAWAQMTRRLPNA